MKKIIEIVKKYETLHNTFTLNDEYEKLLMKVSNNFPYHYLTMHHLLDRSVPKKISNSFKKVCMTEDFPSTKSKLDDAGNLSCSSDIALNITDEK